jgi:hypothetical protein
MRNFFFNMEIMFQKHSCCDGGVKISEDDFESSKMDLEKFDVMKIAVKKCAMEMEGERAFVAMT